jgi:glycosyltransferase involved in cell wall biosynthesis
MQTAIIHDYLTQRGGAERVVLAIAKAFPGAPVYTSLYDPARTFPEFGDLDVRTIALDRIPPFRRWHRLAFPFLAPAFSRLDVDCDVAVCSSSGWAHGAHVSGRKIVYCHAPARWLYQPERYLRTARTPVAAVARALRPFLVKWDVHAAQSASRYLVNSTAVRAQVQQIYGIEAELLPPPIALTPDGERHAVAGIEPGAYVCVSRLLPYKNVDAVIDAFRSLPDERLLVVGRGPERERLRASAPGNVRFLESLTDAELRWLYANSAGAIAASHEDFGLTPLEAAACGRPAAALRWGGFLDTIREDATGVFFDEPRGDAIADAIRRLAEMRWDAGTLEAHAAQFSESRFAERLRRIVAEEEAAARPSDRPPSRARP